MRSPFSSPLPALLLLMLALMSGGAGAARADEALRRVQQSLRDQGFYYGPIDGSPGDETTQAIRRYQIRNGLAVTGALNDETRNAIAKTGAGTGSNTVPRTTVTPTVRSTPPPLVTPSRPTPAPLAPSKSPSGASNQQPDYRIAPREAVQPPRPPGTIRGNTNDDLDEDEETSTTTPTAPSYGTTRERPDLRVPPSSSYGTYNPPSAPRFGTAPSPGLSVLFERSPYEFAPPPVQADTVRRVQLHLLRTGFYDGEADGIPGPQTVDAILNFQEVNRLRRTGRLDADTLSVMRLLPVRRQAAAPRYNAPRPGGVYEGRIVPGY